MSPIGHAVKKALANGAPAPDRYAFTQEDRDRADAIATWLEQRDLPRAWLARKSGISGTTISQILSAKYPSPPDALLQQMLEVLRVEGERMQDGAPGYTEGSVHKLCFVVCDRTRKDANFGVLVGHVGVGKTRTLQEYARRHPLTLMIEADPNMTPGRVLDELLELLRIAPPPGLSRKFKAILSAVKGTHYLLIADEAENLSPTAMHYLRRLRDKAGIGIVLSGTPKLHALLKPETGQFDQVRSRVSMWPATIEKISRNDMDEIAGKALADMRNHDGSAVEATDDVLEALWSYCRGSARVLTESLLPAVRDYGAGRFTVNAKLVEKIAATVLFMKPVEGSR